MFNTPANSGLMMMLDVTMDPESMVYINPYELESVPVRQNSTNAKHIDGMVAFSKIQPSHFQVGRIKNDMEEFKDLSSFVLSSGQQQNVADELNTPIFIKDAFDFMPTDNNNKTNNQHLEDTTTTPNKIATEFDELPIFKEITNFNYDVSEQTSPVSSVHSDATTYSNQQSTELLLLPETTEYDNYFSNNQQNTAYFDVNQCIDISTMDDNTNGHNIIANNLTRDNLKLSLNLTDANHQSLMMAASQSAGNDDVAINTPDVIDDVVDLENVHDFNILDLVKMEDIRLLECSDFDNIKIEPPESSHVTTSNDASILEEESSSPLSYSCQTNQSISRVDSCQNSDDYDDDDDTEYFPPQPVKRRRTNSSIKQHKSIIDSDGGSDDDDHPYYQRQSRKRRRGRPPKNHHQQQPSQISGSNVSSPFPSSDIKYRELRDKNNEASRRSRLKRKLKELEYEREAEEMEMRNVKLKAQVEQLEKMVENFRSNLFKIMMKK